MDNKLKDLKNEFLMYLYDISKISMVRYIADFIQGEDAFLLRLYLNGAMTPKALSEDLKVTKGRITALILTLKRKKYLMIRKNEEDKRSILIDLSLDGKKYLEEKLSKADRYFDKVFNLIGIKDAERLVLSLKNILSKVQED